MDETITTIRARRGTIEKLRKIIEHPRETNEDIINRLIQKEMVSMSQRG